MKISWLVIGITGNFGRELIAHLSSHREILAAVTQILRLTPAILPSTRVQNFICDSPDWRGSYLKLGLRSRSGTVQSAPLLPSSLKDK